MADYCNELLNYLGYDPVPCKLFISTFRLVYPANEELDAFLKLPVSKQNEIFQKIQRQVRWKIFKDRIKNLFS